jgi:hypothetical protein
LYKAIEMNSVALAQKAISMHKMKSVEMEEEDIVCDYYNDLDQNIEVMVEAFHAENPNDPNKLEIFKLYYSAFKDAYGQNLALALSNGLLRSIQCKYYGKIADFIVEEINNLSQMENS